MVNFNITFQLIKYMLRPFLSEQIDMINRDSALFDDNTQEKVRSRNVDSSQSELNLFHV